MLLYWFNAICIIFLTSKQSEALIKEAPLPLELKKCYEHYSKSSLSNVVGKSLCWFCEAPIKRKMEGVVKELLPEQKTYVDGLYDHIDGVFRGKRQAEMCVRKEYRMLTYEERFNFHRAVNLLKANTTVRPNKYDAIALLHTGQATLIAHGGPNFFGWHRIYLLMMERALQEEVPGVCLPYIDNTLESEIDEDEISYLFSDEFLGTANGAVTSGPFANWTTPSGPLTRNVGNQGEPMSKEHLDAILSRSSMAEVIAPSADTEFDMEFHHGSFHVFIGGHMESLDRASFDPTFFMHHTYVDYMWQLFREELRRKGVDPTLYPESASNSEFHARNASLGFGSLVTEDGYSEAIVNYVYMPAPTCSPQNPHCGSVYLRCNRLRWRCVPVNPNTNPGPTTPIPTTPDPVTPQMTTPEPPHPTTDQPTTCNGYYKRDKNRFIRAPKSCQNTFCVDGKCDINQWIYLPVKIITNRPPEYEGSSSYPVRNGKIETRADIYEPQVYANVNQYVRRKPVAPKGYANCEDTHGIGQIFISSQGLNYDGYYSESSIVDQRLATSISIAYMAVKNMGFNGKTTALLRAFDQCGRICHTACKVPGSNPPKNRPCSGVVDITPDFPRQYGMTFGDALLDVWGYRHDRECPTFDTNDFFISFYCDYKDRLPWVNGQESSTMNGIILPQPPPQQPQTILPVAAPQCELTSTCTVNVACGMCSKYGLKLPCINDCSQYALCVYGQFRTRNCPDSTRFDESHDSCVRGSCANSRGRFNFGRSFNMFSNQLFG